MNTRSPRIHALKRVSAALSVLLAITASVSKADLITVEADYRGIYGADGAWPTGYPNYLVGSSYQGEARTYVGYNYIPELSPGTVIIAATLNLQIAYISSPSEFETLSIFSVDTPYSEIIGTAPPTTDVFADLGNGTLYGAVDVSASDGGVISIPLTPDAIADITADAGLWQSFMLGMTLTTLDNPGDGYGESISGPFNPRSLYGSSLTLEIVPEPSSALLLMLGLAGLLPTSIWHAMHFKRK